MDQDLKLFFFFEKSTQKCLHASAISLAVPKGMRDEVDGNIEDVRYSDDIQYFS